MKNNKARKKSKNRLAFQVTGLVAVFFMILIIGSVFAIYRSSVTIFLSAKNSIIERDLQKFIGVNNSYTDFKDWYYKYCREHYEEIVSSEEITDPGAIEEYNSIDLSADDPDKELENASAKVQLMWAQNKYFMTKYPLCYELEAEFNDYEAMYIMDVSEENYGFIYCHSKGLNDENLYSNGTGSMGTRKIEGIDDHPAVKEIFRDQSDTVHYEIFKDPESSANLYIGYYPFAVTKDSRIALCLEYNWDDFRGELLENIYIITGILLLGMLVLCLIMMRLFARVFIDPISKMQGSLKRYIKNKNSSEVVDSMSGIRARNELGALAGDVSELAVEMERYNAENTRLAKERESAAAELRLAAKIQNDNIPKTFPEHSAFKIYGTMTPAKEVGGDFFDFFMIDDDHLGLVIADVSGKSVPAALFMMMSKRLIDTCALRYSSPAEVFFEVNEEICRSNDEQMFVTAWYGVVELSTGRMKAVNAGHNYPVIRRPDGIFEVLKDKHGMFLGGLPGTVYEEYELTLEKGSTVFVYTDGVPEANSPADELFGTERLVEALNSEPDADPKKLLENVHSAVKVFIDTEPQYDDLTMLALKLI